MNTRSYRPIFCLLLFGLLLFAKLSAQVTIGSQIPPSEGALLDLKEFNDQTALSGGRTAQKGLGMPRVKLLSLTTADNNVASTVNEATGQWNMQDHIGLLVFNTNKIEQSVNRICPGLHIWNGTQWTPLKPYPVGAHSCDEEVSLPFIINAPDVATCAGTPIHLTATASEGATIYWYTKAVGGSPVATGTPFIVSPSSTTTYYVKAEKDGIKSATRTAVVASINALPTIASATPSARCGTGTVTLSATASTGASVRWYTAATGGTALATNNNYTTPSISATTTYYAEAYNATTGCISATRTAVVASINALPTITSATPSARCGTGTITLSATASTGASVRWYTAATGGTALATNNNYTTPSISATTTYYAEAYNATTGCISGTRTAVVASINALPTITSATPSTRCGTGTVTLSATASTGASVRWYTAATGGTALATNNNYTTPSISATTTYYAEAYNATTGCISGTRTAVVASVNDLPTITASTPGARCSTGEVTLSATASTGASVRWYSEATGGSILAATNSFITPSLLFHTTYYAEAYNATTGCASATRTPVLASVNTLPTISFLGRNNHRCGPGTLTLSAEAGFSDESVRWYSEPAGGTPLFTGNDFTTPHITISTTYYVDAYNATTGCVSAKRTPVLASVSFLPTISESTASSRCGEGTVTLSAISSGGSSVHWYSAATGGTAIATTKSFTTPNLTSTTTYYAEAYSGLTGCVSATRTPVVATVIPLPTITATTPSFTCGPGTVTLSATASDGASIRWFTATNTVLPVGMGSTFTTPELTSNTTYYAEAYNKTTGCISDTRTPVLATVNMATTIAVTDAWLEKAGTGTMKATATSSTIIRWYNTPTGGNVVNTGSSYTVYAAVPTVYYVEAYNETNGCISERVEVWIRPCGAWVSPTKYKYFKCHNMGAADTTLDPFTPSKGINGSYYQWGRGTVVATVDTPSGNIVGWNKTDVPSDSWNDDVKTANDPCPTGWRIPRGKDLKNITNLASTLNTYKPIGKWGWSSRYDYSAGAFFGDGIMLPVAGLRKFDDGVLQMLGDSGNYWSSTDLPYAGEEEANRAIFLLSDRFRYAYLIQATGASIRCMEE